MCQDTPRVFVVALVGAGFIPSTDSDIAFEYRHPQTTDGFVGDTSRVPQHTSDGDRACFNVCHPTLVEFEGDTIPVQHQPSEGDCVRFGVGHTRLLMGLPETPFGSSNNHPKTTVLGVVVANPD